MGRILVWRMTTKRVSNNDPDFCNHNNRCTQWYQLTNRWGGVRFTSPTKESNYNLHNLEVLADLARKIHDANSYDLGICRRCRSVVVNCKGCYKRVNYCESYDHGNEHYTSLWCSRRCFEDEH